MLPTKNLNEVITSLKSGEIIAFPTETSYGLLGNVLIRDVIMKIYQIKGREKKLKLSLLAADLAMARRLVEWNEALEKIAKKYWPGPLTIVAKAKIDLEGITHDKKIALRVSSKKGIQKLFQEIDFPLTATSANLSGEGDLYSSAEIMRVYKKRVFSPDLVYSGGKIPFKKPSTIVDLSSNKPKLIREGELKFSEILRALEK